MQPTPLILETFHHPRKKSHARWQSILLRLPPSPGNQESTFCLHRLLYFGHFIETESFYHVVFGVLLLSLDVFKTYPLYHGWALPLFHYQVIFRHLDPFRLSIHCWWIFWVADLPYYLPCSLVIYMKQLENKSFELDSTLATSCEELIHWKRLWCWEGLGAGGEGEDRGWDGWMASLTWWTWVWVNSRSWWWTGRPGVLQFMGWQRVGHD